MTAAAAIALSLINNQTLALATPSVLDPLGGLTVRGPVTVAAHHDATELTDADADVVSGLAGVGAAIAVGVDHRRRPRDARAQRHRRRATVDVRRSPITPSIANADCQLPGSSASARQHLDKPSGHMLAAHAGARLQPAPAARCPALDMLSASSPAALSGVTARRRRALVLPVTQALPELSPVVGSCDALAGLPVPLRARSAPRQRSRSTPRSGQPTRSSARAPWSQARGAGSPAPPTST